MQQEQRKWYQLQKMTKKEYGKTAASGLLAGYVFSAFGGSIIMQVVGDTLALASLICGVVWIVLTIKEKIKK